MKSIKILGIAVATLGVAASVGGAIALYTKAAQDVGFGIGAGEYHGSEGVVTYKVNGNTSGSVAPTYLIKDNDNKDVEVAGLQGSSCQVKYEFTLSATYASDLAPQTNVMGNFAISLTNIPEAYRGKLAVWVSVDGYDADTIGKSSYEHVFMTEDFAINSTEGHTQYVDAKDICVASSGVQKVSVYLKYSNLPDTLASNEAALGYTLSVTWAKASNDFAFAYVVGTGNKWTEDDEFAMAPDISHGTWQWMYNGLVGNASWTEAKCKNGSAWSHKQDGDNHELENGKVYDIYWNGEDGGISYFTPRS